MARLPRPDIAHVPQHVVQRGNNRMPCFFDDDDRRRYLNVLREASLRHRCSIHAYVLMSNHVHLLVFYPPKVRLSELVNSLKGVSSRLLKKEFPQISAFWSVRKSRGVLWTPSYFAGSVGGAPLTILKQYIENQGRGDRG